MSLRSHKPTIRKVETRKAPLRSPPTPSEQRMSGRPLQRRRLSLWTKSPYCAKCGRLTDYPHGFELDHIERLDQGGLDIESNTQVLCVYWDETGKHGCHMDKTAEEVRQGARDRQFK